MRSKVSDDVYEIQRLLYIYCEYIDCGDLHGMAELFRDATLKLPGDVPDIVNDPAAIAELYSQYTRIYASGTPGTKHTVSNPIIDFDMDGTTACCRSYIVVFQGIEEFPLQPIIAGRNLDSFRKTGDGWRFSERTIVSEQFGDLSKHMLQPFGPENTG